MNTYPLSAALVYFFVRQLSLEFLWDVKKLSLSLVMYYYTIKRTKKLQENSQRKKKRRGKLCYCLKATRNIVL